MKDRENLIELLLDLDIVEDIGAAADYLIACGVTIPVRCKDCMSQKWDGYASRCVNPRGLRGDIKDDCFCPHGRGKE